MKFSVHSPTFLAIANTIIRGLGTKDPQASSTFKIEKMKDDTLRLFMTCRSQGTFFKGSVPIINIENDDNNEIMQWSVDGSQLKVILSVLSKIDTSITFTMSDSNRLFILEQNGNKIKLPVFEYPTLIKEEKIEKIAVVSANDFMQDVGNLSRLVSTEVALQEHASSCLHISVNKDGLTCMSTDSIGLVEVKEPIGSFENEAEVLIKGFQANLLISNLYDPSDVLQLINTKTMFGYVDKFDNICLVSKTSFAPINYVPILNMASREQSIIINKDDFKYMIDSLAKLCSTSSELKFIIQDNVFYAENDNKDRMTIPSMGTCANTEININKPTLSKLDSVMTQNIKMCWADDAQNRRIISFINLNNENEEFENTFMGVISH